MKPAPDASLAQLDRRLTGAGLEPADSSTLTRALYASDASIYHRIHPGGRAPANSRGALLGPRCSPPLRRRRHHARRQDVLRRQRDRQRPGGRCRTPPTHHSPHRPRARVAVIDPGVVQADLTKAALQHGLRYGPDPSTANRCTVGGMISNNACGPRALGYGRSSDNVVALDIITGTGERLTLDSRTDARASDSPAIAALAKLAEDNADLIRASSAASDARCPATAWSGCCPRNASTWPSSSPAPRARSA